MNARTLNRQQLETLSFSELTSLADEYGIEVPENLDRRFLIGELLDITSEELIAENTKEEMKISSELPHAHKTVLPKNYNETQVCAILRTPSWAFVFWNISDSDSNKMKVLPGCTLMLRVCSLESPEDQMPTEAFEIKVTADNQEQYVLLPSGKKYIRIELVFVAGQTGKVLAFSPVLEIPQGSKFVTDYQPGRDTDYSKIAEISGIKKLLLEQYNNYGHTFA